MTHNLINVYKTSASTHETLYKQYFNTDISPDVNMVISGTSAGLYSYVFIYNGEETKNFKLRCKTTVTFVPGSYNHSYYTNNLYALFVSSVGSDPLIIFQNISIFNS